MSGERGACVVRTHYAWLAAGVAVLLLSGAARAEVKHPAAHHAAHAAAEAIKEIEGAGHNFGGHKDRAVAALRAAITQIEKALESAKDTLKPKDLAVGPHGGLRHADAKIGEAIRELEASKHIGPGHKEAAIRDLRAAHAQVKECLKHHTPPKKK